MANNSDQIGRAFEYAIVSALTSLSGVSLTDRAKIAQQRDRQKFNGLDRSRSEEFRHASRILAHTFSAYPYTIGTSIVDRIPDNEARDGDVTDIRIWPSGSRPPINLSIKSHHFALKHQRPPSLMQQLGFTKSSAADIEYRVRLQEIFDSFIRTGRSLSPRATQFRELKDIEDDFIDRCLYAPVCDLVSSVLGSYLQSPIICQDFFRFLVGNTDYIKIVLCQEYLEFIYFSQLVIPSSCVVEFSPTNPSYIYLTFDNNWKISMRLHTASSQLVGIGKTISTKFDTQPIQMPLASSRIPCR